MTGLDIVDRAGERRQDGLRMLAASQDIVVHEEVARKSGGTCPFYVEGRRLVLAPDTLGIAARATADLARRWGATHVGGEVASALPLIGAAVYAAESAGQALGGCFFRDAGEPDPRSRPLEGELPPGSRLLLVDDVVGLGTVIRRCRDLALDQGHVTVGALAVVSRDGGTGIRALHALGLPALSLLDVSTEGALTVGSYFAAESSR